MGIEERKDSAEIRLCQSADSESSWKKERKEMEINEQTLVVVTDLYVGHEDESDEPMGSTGPSHVDLLGIVTKVNRESETVTVDTRGYGGWFAGVPFESLIPLAELTGKDYDDPEEALRDFLPEVIVKIARQANETS